MSLRNASWDPCHLIHFVEVGGRLTHKQCVDLLQHAAGDDEATQAFVFILTLGVRMEGAFWIAMAVSCWYSLWAGERAIYFLLFAATASTICVCIEATTAGMVPYGSNPTVTPHLQQGATPFVAIWGLISACLCLGVWGSMSTQKEKKGKRT